MCISCLPIRMSFVGLYSVLLSGTVFADFTYYVPQVVDGRVTEGGDEVFQTAFTFVNLSEKASTVTLNLTTDEGEPFRRFCRPQPFGGTITCDDTREFTIPPFGSYWLATYADTSGQQDFPRPSLIGWGKIEASHAIEPVVTLYLRKLHGEILTATVVPSARLLDDFTFPARNKCGGMGDTGLALLNPSSAEDVIVTFKLYKGSELLDQRTISLESLGKLALFLDQDGLFTELGCFLGMVRISSSVPLSSGVILLDDGHWIGVPVFEIPQME